MQGRVVQEVMGHEGMHSFLCSFVLAGLQLFKLSIVLQQLTCTSAESYNRFLYVGWASSRRYEACFRPCSSDYRCDGLGVRVCAGPCTSADPCAWFECVRVRDVLVYQ